MRNSRLKFLLISALMMAIVAVACGSDGGEGVAMGGSEDYPKRIRMIESISVFTEADMKAVGWKGQRDFILEYPGTSLAKWGFMNQKEVGLLIYASAEDASTLGVTAAEEQTFRREEDGQAPDGNLIDRISCRDAAGASAVKANTGFTSKSFSASYLDPEIGETDDIQAVGGACSNRFPTYNDYTVIGNIVIMCESDDRNLTEPSTNCEKIEEWLTAS
ncbi:MAG TPA: hypothetical protein EYQ61_07605 [Dehalococcoidia bacterium]|nr:hypothetical protein [Dehalococcoidia bacterium]HIK90218.1 hypothetical protein [Dehalococcoidia bacterium]